MVNLVGLPDSGNTFLLIDGAKVNDVSQAIYREELSPRCDVLYRKTELADLSEVSPWLVETRLTSALVQRCFDEWKPLGVAIILQADCQFDEVLEYLRGLLTAQLASGEGVVFRFYGPESGRLLLSRGRGGVDTRRLMGPCRAVAIQDRRTGEWECFYNDQPSSERQNEVFNIREEHQAAMERAAERTALRKLELHTVSYFPHLLQQSDANGQDWKAVSALMDAAKTRGLYSTRDIALYINIIGWLGHNAFEDSDVLNLWEENSTTPGKAIARIAEFAEKKSTEGLVHG